MKKYILPCTPKIVLALLVFCMPNSNWLAAESVQTSTNSGNAAQTLIAITTARSQMSLLVGADRHLYQIGFGVTNNAVAIPQKALSRDHEFYPPAGDGYLFEPALAVTHADGNTSTDLQFVKQESSTIDSNVALTRIELKDSFYPFHIFLNFKTYRAEDVIEQWVEISHEETNTVTLERFASAAPEFPSGDYWLTQFHGDWAKEAQLAEEKLTFGMKVLDTKLGAALEKSEEAEPEPAEAKEPQEAEA